MRRASTPRQIRIAFDSVQLKLDTAYGTAGLKACATTGECSPPEGGRYVRTSQSKAERVAANGRPPARRRPRCDHRTWRRAPVGCSRTGPGRDRIAFDSVRLKADTT